MSTLKSAGITNRDATPSVLTNTAVSTGRTYRSAGRVATTATGAGSVIGDILIACSIPSNAIIVSVLMSAPDIGTTTAADIGLYQTTANGGAVADADFFTAAVVLNAGAITKSEKAFGNVLTIAKTEQRVWELLALSVDPLKDYDVALTITGTADAAGSVLVEVFYVI